MSSPFLFPFSFAILSALLGALAMPGADFAPEHLAAGIEGAHFAQAGHHLEPFDLGIVVAEEGSSFSPLLL